MSGLLSHLRKVARPILIYIPPVDPPLSCPDNKLYKFISKRCRAERANNRLAPATHVSVSVGSALGPLLRARQKLLKT